MPSPNDSSISRQSPLRRWALRLRARCDAFLTLGAFAKDEDPTAEPNPEMLAEVERTLSVGWFAGSFGTAVETRFQHSTTELRNQIAVRVLLSGILVYNLFLPVDVFVVPDVLGLAIALHVCVGTPVALAALALIKRQKARSILPLIVTLATVVATTLIIFLSSRSPHADLIACAFALIITSSNTGVLLSFRRAALFTLAIDAAAGAAILLHPSLDVASKLFCLLITVGMSFYSMLGAYRIEASIRRAYLFSLRESLRAKTLAATNRQLQGLVDVDGLTGVGNRRYFDDTLALHWRTETASLALVMLDIDHFKSFNDRYGHLAGDACLRAVASVLDRECHGAGITVARYGGEEFALLMPGLDLEDAACLADRLRLAIMTLSLRIGPDGPPVVVTASFGCAAVRPRSSATALDLVAAADAALYQAKRNGRNRTQAAPMPCVEAMDATRAA